ncbi:MAG: HTTM domain-containing protein [Planctomycetaceae bacterium]|nr:HTTM domain-containing protein [Planctomycetaceae bacterium]
MLQRPTSILRDMFGIDARCLGVFRIVIASILLADLALRSRFIVENYTDDGFLPRDLVVAPDCYMSLQMLNGSYAFQVGHFVLAALSGLMLLVGYRTRTATALCWLLTISLHARNTFLLDAGDDLLRSMLFWSLFLPLGLRYSIDGRHVDGRRDVIPDQRIILSASSAALLLQFACVYFFAGWFKTDPEWTAGTAIERALGQTQWIRPAGQWLGQYPTLLRYMTPAVVWFEIIAPLCLFIPWRTRTIRMFVIPAFWMFQFGLGMTIWLHIFPLITAAATIPFLSSLIWPEESEKNTKAETVTTAAGSKHTMRRRIVWNSALAVLAATTIVIQAANFGKNFLPTEERIVSLIGWNAIWSMYTTTPKYSYQFSSEATLANGETIDLINSEVTTTDRMRVQQLHSSYRFRYFLETASSACPGFPSRYLAHLVYRWNQTQTEDRFVVNARIIGTAKAIGEPGPGESTVLLEMGVGPAESE